jgi:hypothetical protein
MLPRAPATGGLTGQGAAAARLGGAGLGWAGLCCAVLNTGGMTDMGKSLYCHFPLLCLSEPVLTLAVSAAACSGCAATGGLFIFRRLFILSATPSRRRMRLSAWPRPTVKQCSYQDGAAGAAGRQQRSSEVVAAACGAHGPAACRQLVWHGCCQPCFWLAGCWLEHSATA